MDADFWHERWETNNIAFHEGAANALLVKFFRELSLPKGSRVFVPLCGKTRDIGWLLSGGYRVAGSELSETAVRQLFVDLETEPEVSQSGPLKHYRAEDIDIFCGDIFDISADRLGSVSAVYDRAALVALPEGMRTRYTAHLKKITGHVPQLLITLEYDQALMEGPPFSIDSEEVHRHYQGSHRLALLESAVVPGGLKGQCPAEEHAWLMTT